MNFSLRYVSVSVRKKKLKLSEKLLVGKLQIFSFQHCRCAPPQVVAFAESVEQVSGVAKLCNEHRVPLVPFGSGTGLEGGINAIRVSSWNILFMYKETHVTSLSSLRIFNL